MTKLHFQHHYTSLKCNKIIKKLMLSMLKTVVRFNISVETMIHFFPEFFDE